VLTLPKPNIENVPFLHTFPFVPVLPVPFLLDMELKADNANL